MEAQVILKVNCNNSAAINYIVDILSTTIMKQKLDEWKIEIKPN